MKITKSMSIGEVVNKWPITVNVFMEAGLHCYGCVVAQFENIEQGALAHGIDVETLIEQLNNAIESDSDITDSE